MDISIKKQPACCCRLNKTLFIITEYRGASFILYILNALSCVNRSCRREKIIRQAVQVTHHRIVYLFCFAEFHDETLSPSRDGPRDVKLSSRLMPARKNKFLKRGRFSRVTVYAVFQCGNRCLS